MSSALLCDKAAYGTLKNVSESVAVPYNKAISAVVRIAIVVLRRLRGNAAHVSLKGTLSALHWLICDGSQFSH